MDKTKHSLNYIFLLAIIVLLICAVLIQEHEIRCYKQSENEWVELSKLWREKLDTCMERNARIYEQLNEFKDIRIEQLKENK